MFRTLDLFLCVMAVMVVVFLNPLGKSPWKRGKNRAKSPMVFAGLVVVLVERADRKSVAGLGPTFEEGSEESRSRGSRSPSNQSRRFMGVNQTGHWNIQLDG